MAGSMDRTRFPFLKRLIFGALLFGLFGSSVSSVEGADPEKIRYSVRITENGDSRSVDVDAYVLPGKRKAKRVIFVPLPPNTLEESDSSATTVDREEWGLPLGSLVTNSRGAPRPELTDPHRRDLVSALLSWFEADQIVTASWRAPESDGEAEIEVPSLKLMMPLPVTHRLEAGTESRGPVVRLELKEPVTRSGNLSVELKRLRWAFELDDQQRFSRGEIRREVIQTAGSFKKETDARVAIQVLERTELETAEAKAIADEFDALRPIVRALLSGQTEEQIRKAGKELTKFRRDHPKGALGGSLPELEVQLASAEAQVAGLADPDKAAQKMIGKPAPDFTLKDLEGNDVSLSSFKGKSVVLSFWGYT